MIYHPHFKRTALFLEKTFLTLPRRNYLPPPSFNKLINVGDLVGTRSHRESQKSDLGLVDCFNPDSSVSIRNRFGRLNNVSRQDIFFHLPKNALFDPPEEDSFSRHQKSIVREFDLQVSKWTTRSFPALNKLYSELKGSHRINSYELSLRFLNQIETSKLSTLKSPKKDSEPPPIPWDERMIAWFMIHSFLYQDDLCYYVPDNQLYRETGTIYRRSEEEILSLKQQIQNVRLQAPPFQSLVDKIKQSMDTHLATKLTYTYSPEEIQLLDSLELYTLPRRFCSLGPYSKIAVPLLKSTGIFDTMDASAAREVLLRLKRLFPYKTTHERLVRPFLTLSNSKETQDDLEKKQHSTLREELQRVLEQSHRYDFGALPVYAIDDASAKEIDDGISLEWDGSSLSNAWVHIHVADPTSLIQPQDAIANQAELQGTSLYLPDRHHPMIPFSVSSLFSLGFAGREAQPALTFSVKVNAQGEVVDFKIRSSIIRNVQRMTYQEVDGILEKNETTGLSQRDEELKMLDQVQKALYQKRLREGALVILQQQHDVQVSYSSSDLSEPPKITFSHFTPEGQPSRQLVSEMMILAGTVAGMFCQERSLAGIFRLQAAPILRLAPQHRGVALEEDTWIKEYSAQHQLLPAMDDTTVAPHTLMGIPTGYTRVTSPLRRYMDLVMHWQLKGCLNASSSSTSPVFTKEQLQNLLSPCSPRHQLYHQLFYSRLYYRGAQRFWKLYYLSMQDPQRIYTAKSIKFGSRLDHTLMYLEGIGIKARVANYAQLQGTSLCDRFNVVIHQVVPFSGQISLHILSKI